MSIGVNNASTSSSKYQELTNAAVGVATTLFLANNVLTWPIDKCGQAIMRDLPAKDEVVLGIDKTINHLKKNGNLNLTYFNITKHEDIKFLIKIVKESKYLNWLQKFSKCRLLKDAYKGKNSFVDLFMLNSKPHTNIYMNSKKLAHTFFHEVGHAMNYQTSKFWRFLQKNRTVAGFFIPFALLTTALLKNKKQKGEKPQGFFDKTTTFIKENVGKLVFLSALPIIAEEAKASLNGQKLAKKFLSNKNYKNVVHSNSIGLLTYILGAAAIGWLCNNANKINDKTVKPQLQILRNNGIQQQYFTQAKLQRRS